LPAPLPPVSIERRIQAAIEHFLEQGLSSKADVARFVAGLPVHQAGGYGGNTPCVEIQGGQDRIIIDAGSGIRPLGYELLSGPCGKGQGEVHLLFTHFHWDHLIGLPFFTPIFIPGNTIHVYAVQPDLPDVFRTVFRKPYFPLNLEQLGAKIVYHRLEPRKPHRFGELEVTPYQLDHPDPCWGFKVERGGKAVAHCVDTECTRMSREALGPDLPLYQNLDLMIFDAQYTLMETIEKVNWGHAAASLGVDIALRERVKHVLFMHHDPASTDEKISQAEAQARKYFALQEKNAKRVGESFPSVEWSFAREGMVVEL
jgi:phosphoribosyl 1,2-cyclic phosphodiesterase